MANALTWLVVDSA